MKTLIAFVVLIILCATAVAAPHIPVYRYQNNVWVRDDKDWSSKSITLLVHGFPAFNEGNNRAGLLALAAHLSQLRKIDIKMTPAYDAIYAIEYPIRYHNIETAATLADIVHNKCRNLLKEIKIDVFAHSMGGLVARPAIECPETILGTKNLSDRVRNLVMMGTPNNGFSMPEIEIFKQSFGDLPEVSDMDSGGMFISGVLNFPSAKKPKVACDYYSIIGRRSYRPVPFLSDKSGMLARGLKKLMDNLVGVHDGLVKASSAGYDLSPFCHLYKKAELDLNHDYIKSHQEVFDVIDKWMIQDEWFDSPGSYLSSIFNSMLFRETDPNASVDKVNIEPEPKTIFRLQTLVQIALHFTDPKPIKAKIWYYNNYHLSIYGPDNKSCFETDGSSGSDDGDWGWETSYQYLTVTHQGTYRVELMDEKQTQTIATATFEVE